MREGRHHPLGACGPCGRVLCYSRSSYAPQLTEVEGEHGVAAASLHEHPNVVIAGEGEDLASLVGEVELDLRGEEEVLVAIPLRPLAAILVGRPARVEDGVLEATGVPSQWEEGVVGIVNCVGLVRGMSQGAVASCRNVA